MRIAVVGGGPGGSVLRRAGQAARPAARDHRLGAQRADDTFGFGVVFSDETLGGIEHADAAITRRCSGEFARWDDIDVHYRGTVTTSGGHGFAAMSRRRLLGILQEPLRRARRRAALPRTGARRRDCSRGYDLVVAADGVNSAVRAAVRRGLPAPRRDAPLPVHLAGHGPGVRRLQVLRPRDAGRGHAGPRLPVRPRRQHVHPRGARRRVAAAFGPIAATAWRRARATRGPSS